MILYALSIFVSAFLLFQIQPMISRYILPFFGGTPAVWTTVLLFFQVLLTGGYAYASWLIRRVHNKMQVGVHIALLNVSLLVLAALGLSWPSPVTPGPGWKPLGVDTPIFDIFKLLIVAVGLPYFLLSTNSPLMQAWFNRSKPGRSPYWLYALSNIGSLLGLITYPFLIEPNLTLKTQGWIWAAGYTLFVLLAGLGAFLSTQTTPKVPDMPKVIETPPAGAKPSNQVQVLWVLLSAVASTLLLATTTQITQEVAAIPLLWVLPLSIYLISFILTYSNERFYNRRVFGLLMILASVGYFWAVMNSGAYFVPQIIAYCFMLFVGAMICNGETYRLRPDPSRLTHFYLMTSIGGALGGIFVNLIAPYVFNGYWELPISCGLALALTMALFVTRKTAQQKIRVRFIHNVMVSGTVFLLGFFSLYVLGGGKLHRDIFEARNFYGLVHVKDIYPEDPEWHGYYVAHGITVHGKQFIAPDKHRLPTTYFTEQSGIGLAMLNNPKYTHGMRIGILGLGIGVLAAYGQPGDAYRFYEINPIMAALAEGRGGYFSYLSDCRAEHTVILGDARISLERELATTGSNNFDILVIDVYSGDAVPVHLITREAFDIYLKHLAPDGILAAHISNRFLDLVPVLWQHSKNFHLTMAVIYTGADNKLMLPSLWVLMSPSPALLQIPAIAERAIPMDNFTTHIPQWTDDYSNLFQIMTRQLTWTTDLRRIRN
jgi:hypothetical protein